MKEINFRLVDQVYVEHMGVRYDLHNNYNFKGVSYDPVAMSVVLEWTKSEGAWAQKEVLSGLQLVYQGVSIFLIHSPHPGLTGHGGCDLGFMGYLHPDDIGVMDGFLFPRDARPGFHMVFGFDNDLSIKLYSRTVELVPLTG